MCFHVLISSLSDTLASLNEDLCYCCWFTYIIHDNLPISRSFTELMKAIEVPLIIQRLHAPAVGIRTFTDWKIGNPGSLLVSMSTTQVTVGRHRGSSQTLNGTLSLGPTFASLGIYLKDFKSRYPWEIAHPFFWQPCPQQLSEGTDLDSPWWRDGQRMEVLHT